ncbi:DinB family protein [Trinickia sp.]|uniref:DinB family protein n=1 Tax=Trinickia sp. TaxID=2571163 RepID=UPI003F7E5BFF
MASNNEKMLARYNQWANEVIFKAVADLPEAEIVAPQQSILGSLMRTLGHSYAVGAIFQAHLERRAHGFTVRQVPDATTFDALYDMQRDLDAWYVAWIDDVGDSQLDERIRFRFLDGSEGEMARNEMFFHVVNHYTYHRGFAVEALHRMSVAVPKMDLTVYLCDHARK